MKDIKVRFGIEFEFWNYKDGGLYDPEIIKLPSKWLHCREWYYGEHEIMTNPVLLRETNFIKKFETALEVLRTISYENKCMVSLTSEPYTKYETIGSNGIHIHLSFFKKDGNRNVNLLRDNWPINFAVDNGYLDKVLFSLMEKEGLIYSPRVGMSHHIWGYRMSSSYDFKSNPKYQPIIISPSKNRKPRTLEIRVFDLDLIFKPKVVYKIVKSIAKEVLKINSSEYMEYCERLLKKYEIGTKNPMRFNLGLLEKAFNENDAYIVESGDQWDYYYECCKEYTKKEKPVFIDGVLTSKPARVSELMRFILN